jgi:signal transduction histidine kinase
MTSQQQLQEELERLREDYNQLERNFDSMSEGYQESLLLYDRLEETCRELEETNRKLDIARQKAEESSRMKSHFIQQISHEIRTPLNILSGFTQVVTSPDMELDEDTKASINQQILENTDRITRLVNKMLELSDASSKTVIERNDQTTALQIAAEAVEASDIATAPHLNFNMHIAKEAENIVITTDRQSAVRALTLILGNARKFTKEAEAHARHDITEEKKQATLLIDTTDHAVRFIIEDNGIGIPAHEADHIFEEFVQLNPYYDGTGIGLTVARSLARRLGGDIVLDTTYTPATRFVMTLPI